MNEWASRSPQRMILTRTFSQNSLRAASRAFLFSFSISLRTRRFGAYPMNACISLACSTALPPSERWRARKRERASEARATYLRQVVLVTPGKGHARTEICPEMVEFLDGLVVGLEGAECGEGNGSIVQRITVLLLQRLLVGRVLFPAFERVLLLGSELVEECSVDGVKPARAIMEPVKDGRGEERHQVEDNALRLVRPRLLLPLRTVACRFFGRDRGLAYHTHTHIHRHPSPHTTSRIPSRGLTSS